ncbi:ATPase [Bacillus sp. FJAT-27231]|uniref:VirD4-like conjugal transfer protein, CD1115 family n=1 Tax=Bacillus sp. FJAT-27231 TaxID=1679168 RepID=UPI0006712BB4|nr:type IV secretory system conjugative DNA transfer family protein [Bacillus sp. FJAT-27231]KMY52495.1 ATPase [Bacillus sp. FJAT-27231]
MKGKSIKHIFAEKQALIPLSACLFILIFLVANFLFNTILELIRTTFSDVMNPQPFKFSIDNFFLIRMAEYPIFYIIICLIAGIAVLKFVYEMRSNFKSLNKDQKGSSRFTTISELKSQYKSVPEREERYEGGGGVVISRYKKEVFIDDSPVNNLIIGTTRSGKGESFVFPTIDVYSRAEKQPSLILNDPKGELFSASKETLEKRGYHIEVLNLLNPLESMSYNLLQLVKDAYKEGDYSTAQALCKTLSHTLYYNPNAKDPFWQQCAMSLCNAMILAVTDKCIKEGQEQKITMYAVANMLSELGSQEVEDEEGELQNALDRYFQSLPADSVAKMQYATSNFSKGTTRGGIFTQTMNGLSIFTFDEIAKMTAENSVDLKRVGFGKTIKGKATPLKRIGITFPDGSTQTVKTDMTGRFELNFDQEINAGDRVQIQELESEFKTVALITDINEKTGATKVLTSGNNEVIQVQEMICFDKPVAIFMITPDFDSSNHVIASIFVRQLYFVLAKYASLARGGKCYREVVFMLDEFGNMPSIEGIANIVTVCLGRNIRFNLIIQAYAQLKNKYGDDAPTIDGNCGNTIYILTNDYDTAEKISKKLGEETIDSMSRSGKGFSFDKNKTESVDGRKLLTPNELMALKEGESIVIRVIKRQDKNRKRIKAFPIYNTGKTALKYRWEYLGEEFDTDKSILDIEIHSLHTNIDPKNLLVDFFAKEEKKEKIEEPQKSQEPAKETEPHAVKIEKTEENTMPVNDSPFDELSADNWQIKTMEEFFASDKMSLKLIEQHFLAELETSMEELKQEPMGEVWEKIKTLGANDKVNKTIYQALSGKVKRIIDDLKEKKEEVLT